MLCLCLHHSLISPLRSHWSTAVQAGLERLMFGTYDVYRLTSCFSSETHFSTLWLWHHLARDGSLDAVLPIWAGLEGTLKLQIYGWQKKVLSPNSHHVSPGASLKWKLSPFPEQWARGTGACFILNFAALASIDGYSLSRGSYLLPDWERPAVPSAASLPRRVKVLSEIHGWLCWVFGNSGRNCFLFLCVLITVLWWQASQAPWMVRHHTQATHFTPTSVASWLAGKDDSEVQCFHLQLDF